VKNISPTQIAWLAANPDRYRVDLLTITLPNGQIMRAVCGGAADLAYGGNTYFATANGSWSRGRETSEAMRGEIKSQSVDLTVSAAEGVVYPGTSVPMQETFALGVWDAATVALTSISMPAGQWGTVEIALQGFTGMVSECRKTGRSTATLTCQDWLYLANQQVPKRVIQPGCFNTFGDSSCTFTLIGFANTVGAGFTGVIIPPASSWPATDSRGNSLSGNYSGAGYFANGKVKWTSGQNSGFFSHIASQQSITGATLVLASPPPFPITLGDGFTAYGGCQKTLGDCTVRWGNAAHFLGFPFVPPPEHSV